MRYGVTPTRVGLCIQWLFDLFGTFRCFRRPFHTRTLSLMAGAWFTEPGMSQATSATFLWKSAVLSGS